MMSRDELAAALAPYWDDVRVMTQREYDAFRGMAASLAIPSRIPDVCFVRVARGSAWVVIPISNSMLDDADAALLVPMLTNRIALAYRDVTDPGWQRREDEAARPG